MWNTKKFRKWQIWGQILVQTFINFFCKTINRTVCICRTYKYRRTNLAKKLLLTERVLKLLKMQRVFSCCALPYQPNDSDKLLNKRTFLWNGHTCPVRYVRILGAAWKAINRAKLMVLLIKPTLIWILTSILSTPVDSTPLNSLPCVMAEWRSGVVAHAWCTCSCKSHVADFPKEKRINKATKGKKMVKAFMTMKRGKWRKRVCGATCGCLSLQFSKFWFA